MRSGARRERRGVGHVTAQKSENVRPRVGGRETDRHSRSDAAIGLDRNEHDSRRTRADRLDCGDRVAGADEASELRRTLGQLSGGGRAQGDDVAAGRSQARNRSSLRDDVTDLPRQRDQRTVGRSDNRLRAPFPGDDDTASLKADRDASKDGPASAGTEEAADRCQREDAAR